MMHRDVIPRSWGTQSTTVGIGHGGCGRIGSNSHVSAGEHPQWLKREYKAVSDERIAGNKMMEGSIYQRDTNGLVRV